MRGILTAVGLAVASVTLAAQSYVPQRVFDTHVGTYTDFETMLAAVTTADVVFLGEQHDDPNTHRLELAVLEGLMRRRGNLILSLEMFERDVQDQLDRFAVGQIAETEFLAAARPWPNYATDYKPLVDFAVAHKWPVVAANVPRPMASEVSKGGMGVLDGKPERERRWFAADRRCPTGDDGYYKRFMEAMGSHPGSTGDNFYFAQCLKDETMAESIVGARAAATSGPARPDGSMSAPPPAARIGSAPSGFSSLAIDVTVRRAGSGPLNPKPAGSKTPPSDSIRST
jgi:uncharacterized iron-regulated protein